MAPTATTRRTRSSTQSQTAESRTNAQQPARKPASTKQSTTGVRKPQKKPKIQKKKLAKQDKDAQARQEKALPVGDPDPDLSHVPTHLPPTVFTVPAPQPKAPVLCHSYTPALPPSQSLFSPKDTLLFTHGAGGTLEAPAVVHFCTGFSSITKRRILAFQGSSNLKARVKGFEACWEYATQVMEGTVVFAGRSMGARAAVLASTQLSSAEDGARLILVSYPLQGPKEVRDQILLDLPPSSKVLFILGGRDAMCPLPLLEGVRAKMQARTQIVVARGADHGMNVRPAAGTRIFGERAGRVAARWVDGRDLEEVDGVEEEGTVYIGDEEE